MLTFREGEDHERHRFVDPRIATDRNCWGENLIGALAGKGGWAARGSGAQVVNRAIGRRLNKPCAEEIAPGAIRYRADTCGQGLYRACGRPDR